jgi:hypothetical protein
MDLTMMERVGDRWEKMEGSCSTGQSPQWAVVPVEEEEEEEEEEKKKKKKKKEKKKEKKKKEKEKKKKNNNSNTLLEFPYHPQFCATGFFIMQFQLI